MRKITYIFLSLLISTACSVIKKGQSTNFQNEDNIPADSLLEYVRRINITESNFFISKAEIEVSSSSGKMKFLGSIKYLKPDKYLISLKSKTGIEAVRAFVTKDTVLINDRINRKLYFGKASALKKKIGVTELFFPVIFGDFVCDRFPGSNQIKCINGQVSTNCLINGIELEYVIDCKMNKLMSAILINSLNSAEIEITFNDFFDSGKARTPGKIEIKNLRNELVISIRIKKIESQWKGDIIFIPGSKYELIELL